MGKLLARYWREGTILALGGILASVLVFFGLLGGGTVPLQPDGRKVLSLAPAERDFVLKEMRGLLATTQTILAAALANDLPRAAAAARTAGMSDVRNIPNDIRGPLMGKLPVEFKRLGFSVHEGFDLIALDAEKLGDRQHTLQQLAELMGRCVACHGSYAIASPAP